MKYIYKPSFRIYKNGAIAFNEGSRDYQKYVSEAIFKYKLPAEKVMSFSNYLSAVAGEEASDKKVKYGPKDFAKEQYYNQFHDMRGKNGEKLSFSIKQMERAWKMYRLENPESNIGFNQFAKAGMYTDIFDRASKRYNELKAKGLSSLDIRATIAFELFGS